MDAISGKGCKVKVKIWGDPDAAGCPVLKKRRQICFTTTDHWCFCGILEERLLFSSSNAGCLHAEVGFLFNVAPTLQEFGKGAL